MIPVIQDQSGGLTLIPIISQSSEPKLVENPPSLEAQQYVIFLKGLQQLPLIGSPENACPHCGALELKFSINEVYVYPQLECCSNMIKQYLEWMWEELNSMALMSDWSEEESSKADKILKKIHSLEGRNTTHAPIGGT